MPSIFCTIEYPEDDNKLDETYEVFFEITSYGSPATGPSYASGGEPATDADIEIDKVYLAGEEVEVSDEMLEVFYKEIDNNWNPSWDEGDEPDPDYLRDLREDR